MQIIKCEKCSRELFYADNGIKEEIVNFRYECVCGTENVHQFIGYPKLAGNDDFYFEFVDEDKILCKPRIKYKKV